MAGRYKIYQVDCFNFAWDLSDYGDRDYIFYRLLPEDESNMILFMVTEENKVFEMALYARHKDGVYDYVGSRPYKEEPEDITSLFSDFKMVYRELLEEYKEAIEKINEA